VLDRSTSREGRRKRQARYRKRQATGDVVITMAITPDNHSPPAIGQLGQWN